MPDEMEFRDAPMLTFRDLAQRRCDGCESSPKHIMSLSGRCHPEAPTFVAFYVDMQVLTLFCAVCFQPVVNLIQPESTAELPVDSSAAPFSLN